MAHTQADLDNIKRAIASGELTIESNGRRVTYRSVDELRKARDDVAADLAAQQNSIAGTRRGTYAVRFTTARGD